MALVKVALWKERFFEMVEALFVRRAFELLAMFHTLSRVDGISNTGEKKIETVVRTMRIESSANLTRHRLIESVVRRHLHYDEDDSPVHLLIHSKANPHLTDIIAKACLEEKSTILWTHSDQPKDSNCSRETCYRVSQIIGIYADIEDINPRELKISYGNAWNPRSKILILITELTSDHEHPPIDRVKLQETLETFWSLDCLNVVLITTPKCDKNCTVAAEPRIFNYDPFVLQPGKSAKRGALVERSSQKSLFPDKTNDLRGIEIPVSIYHEEPHSIMINFTKLETGAEVFILRYLAEYLNFSVDLKTAPVSASSYKIRLPNGREVGPIGDLIKKRSDYLANVVFLGTIAGLRVEIVQPFTQAPILMIVPRAGPMPGLIRICRSFDIQLVIAIFVSCIFLFCCFLAMKKRNPFFKIHRLLVSQHIEDIGNKDSERMFSIGWILWAFVVNTALQTQLINDMTDPPFYASIDSLEELASSSLTLMAEPNYLHDLNNSISETRNFLAESAVGELDYAKCTKRLVEHRDVACAIDGGVIGHVARKLNRKYSKNRWRRGIAHIVKAPLTRDWRTFAVREGFPFLDKFDRAFLRMIEAGLVRKWVTDRMGRKFEEGSLLDTHFKLNMEHFDGTFKILLIGEGLALIAFVLEIIVHRIKRCSEDSSNR